MSQEDNNVNIANNDPATGEASLPVQTQAVDASYYIEYNEEGVFVSVDYGNTDGRTIDVEVVVFDIKRKGIEGIDEADIRLKLKWHKDKFKIADPQEEAPADSDVIVVFDKKFMMAEMMLFPPCKIDSTKTADDIVELVREKWGVMYGLDIDVVKNAVENHLYSRYIKIAEGKEPEDGQDGKIVFLFNTEHNYAPKIMDDGSADYKNLNVFESVEEGVTIATRIPAEEGFVGHNVKGVEIPAKKGKEAKFPKRKNVKISEDESSLIAEKSGRIDYKNNRIEINDVYRISGNVDMSVGNINFVGDVIISGNVISDLSIIASGMIEVKGYVEGASLTAGKDIILKNGMQGKDRGKLEAGGNIVARFIEHSTIEAKGNITSDYIVHCNVIAGETITMQGKWGRILGGTVRAGKVITANIVGSPANELTTIMLGASPAARAHYADIINKKTQIRAQLDKINNVAKVYSTNEASPERQEMRLKLITAKDQLEQQYEAILAEIENLNQILSKNSGARLHVIKSIYPNVKLTIDSCQTVTRNIIEFATFRSHEGEISFSSCDKS